MRVLRVTFTLLTAASALAAAARQPEPYRDARLPVDARVKDLLGSSSKDTRLRGELTVR